MIDQTLETELLGAPLPRYEQMLHSVMMQVVVQTTGIFVDGIEDDSVKAIVRYRLHFPYKAGWLMEWGAISHGELENTEYWTLIMLLEQQWTERRDACIQRWDNPDSSAVFEKAR